MPEILGTSGGGSMDEIDLGGFRLQGQEPPVVAQRGPSYDVVVIGSGPAGQKAALTAVEHGARTALVERDPLAGGVCLNTGTIPSKTLREAVLYLTGYRQRGYYGDQYRLKDKITAGDLIDRTNVVIRLEREVINQKLDTAGVNRFVGVGRVSAPNEVTVDCGGAHLTLPAGKIVIATGTRTRRPDDIPFDDVNVFDSDAVFGNANDLRPLPDSIVVLGAGIIGIEYASMFGALDIPTTLVDPRPNPLNFADDDMSSVLYAHLARRGVRLLFDANYQRVELVGDPKDPKDRVRVTLTTGDVVTSDALLFALGRIPVSASLGIADLGVKLDKRGFIQVDANYQTSVPTIYATGDVIGFPALASTSAEQGRVAVLHALGIKATWAPDLLPYGIYTIPEISMVGKTAQQLATEGVPFVSGYALWRETARGKILGDITGALKLVFHAEDKRLLGVHVIGEGATELLHIGQAVMRFSAGLDYFLTTVFNYPTLAEAYKVAAHDAQRVLEGHATAEGTLVERVFEVGTAAEWAKWAM